MTQAGPGLLGAGSSADLPVIVSGLWMWLGGPVFEFTSEGR